MTGIDERDLAIVRNFARDLKALEGLAKFQRDWQQTRWAIERGEFTQAQIDVLCAGCGNPFCVVHGEMPPRLRDLRREQASQDSEATNG